jgi:hypothetical protein
LLRSILADRAIHICPMLRYWSFDPRRDLKWNEITQLHRA